MKPDYTAILLAAHLQLSEQQWTEFTTAISEIKDWKSFVPHSIARQVGPLLYQKLVSRSELTELVPPMAMSWLKQSWLKTLSRSLVLEQHFKEIVDLFHSKGIDLIAMKGIYLSEHLYKEPGLRQFSDIDLLVRVSDGELAIRCLSEAGYKDDTLYMSDFYEKHKDKRQPVHFPAMIKNGVSIEIHCQLYENSSPFRVDMEKMWDKAVEVNLYGKTVKVFSPEHLFINLCLHLDKHFEGGDFQMTGFLDIVNILCGHGVNIDYELMWKITEEWGVKDIVLKYMALSEKYFGVELSRQQLPTACQLPKSTIILFDSKLRGSKSQLNFFKRHAGEFAKFETFREKLLFLWHYFFPSREFIRRRYQPKNNFQLLLYYPYRFWKAFAVAGNALLSWIKSL